MEGFPRGYAAAATATATVLGHYGRVFIIRNWRAAMQFRRNAAGLFRCRRGKQKYDARFSLKNYFRREKEERGGGEGRGIDGN